MRLIDALLPLTPPVCVACSGWAGAREPLCGGCRRALRWLGDAPDAHGDLPCWAPLAYDGPARAVVAALKFRGATRVAGTMAAQVAATAPAGWLDPPAALVPVPLHPARRRKRGFNQAAVLAHALAARAGLPVCACLDRAGSRATQMSRGRRDRLTALEGAITLAARPPPGPIVLIDDVMTTGATLTACAQALKEAGAPNLRAITYARTPGR